MWRVNVRTVSGLAVDQAVQKIQHMRLGRHARIQGKFHSLDDDLLVVMKNESKNIDHLPITAGAAKHLVLQLPKGQRQFQEGRTIAQSTGLALDDGKVLNAFDCILSFGRRDQAAASLMVEDVATQNQILGPGRHEYQHGARACSSSKLG